MVDMNQEEIARYFEQCARKEGITAQYWWSEAAKRIRALPPLRAREEIARDWAVGRWQAEVANRPLQNVHRRALDTTWRQVIRHFGGDDVALCGPAHDDIALSSTAGQEWRDPEDLLITTADAIDAARYAHPDHPRERPRPFAEADRGDREYALRLARAALSVSLSAPTLEGEDR